MDRLKEIICFVQMTAVMAIVAGFCIGTVTTYPAGLTIGILLFAAGSVLGTLSIMKGRI